MTGKQKELLSAWAKKFHAKSFIAGDPVSFPRRYSRRRDIEISALLTAFLSFGNRAQILKTAEKLDAMMHGRPYEYLMSRAWEKDFSKGDPKCFYRMISRGEMREIFRKIFLLCDKYGSLENAVCAARKHPEMTPMECLCDALGVSAKSPQKKLNMFLRWMIRRNSPVDFGIWRKFSPAELIIPLDTHVLHVSRELGLTRSRSYSLSTAKEITRALAEIFPGDPCLGDFALFGAGVSHISAQSGR